MPGFSLSIAAMLAAGLHPADPAGGSFPCVATCLRADAATAEDAIAMSGATKAGDSSASDDAPAAVADLLARWSAASRTLRPPGRSAKIAFAYAHPELNGHRAAFVQACDGPIDADDLAAGMTWAATTEPGRFVTLRGEARDPLAARLLGPVEVVLDGETLLPTTVRFDPPAGIRAEPAVVIALEHRPPVATEFARGVRVASAENDGTEDVIAAEAVTDGIDTPLPYPPPPAE